MKLILVFVIFRSVIAEDSVIRCETCKVIGEGVNNCCGKLKECATGEFCATQIEYNIVGDLIQTIRKSCMPKSKEMLCNASVALNTTGQEGFKSFQMNLFSKCCYTDGCNKEGITMPPVNLTENGNVCPTCFVEGKFSCSEIGMIRCTGNQFECMNFNGTAARPGKCKNQHAFKACVTAGACIAGFENLPGSEIFEDAMYSCK